MCSNIHMNTYSNIPKNVLENTTFRSDKLK